MKISLRLEHWYNGLADSVHRVATLRDEDGAVDR